MCLLMVRIFTNYFLVFTYCTVLKVATDKFSADKHIVKSLNNYNSACVLVDIRAMF
ncbi:hypothetical protein ACYSNM_09975 [Myroides sp. LJL116]